LELEFETADANSARLFAAERILIQKNRRESNMTYKQAYERWLAAPALTPAERAELESIAGNEKEMESRFFGPLEFGTAGLRGTMCTGLHHMNVYVVRHATQAFAQVILEEGAQAASRGVAVCYDCRNHSQEFARQAASVMAANGIPVRIFDALRPTPELSFAVREYGCIAGINVTASHNPKEYNGYKVYWQDGAQLPPRHASAIAKKMEELDIFDDVKTMDYDEAVSRGLITLMGAETDEKFLSHVMAQAIDRRAVEQVADRFKMVYTPFHGTGYKLIPEALRRLGMEHVICVPEQMVIDGNFPTVVSPNPENPEGFALAVELARKEGADFILGSDPDADRVGIMVRDAGGEYVVLTGNQTGVLLLDYLIGAMQRAGTLPEKAVALKTIVTTEMARKVAEENGLACYDTFTGFKFLAEKKDALEGAGEGKVIFSYEESYGYMLGDYVRDKDAVTASLLLTEMAAWYAGQGMTLYDALEALYKKYGYYRERTLNLVMPGLDGLKKMAALMANLRANPPASIGGAAVTARKDYQDGSVILADGGRDTMELKGSNVLRYELADGTSVIVRPSGTEPKVKVYILANGTCEGDCQAKVEACAAWAQSLAQ
jgi:phosphoglucomutase